MNQNQLVSRAFLDQLSGVAIVEFGTDWCSYCQASQPIIQRVVSNNPDIQHIKIEDGKGKRLGRSYAIKLWPTLIFLKDGVEVVRIVRPSGENVITEALAKLK